MDAAGRFKIVLETSNRDEAYRVAGLLGEVVEPTAAAVAVFEVLGDDVEAPPRGWRLDAYYEAAPDADLLASAVADLSGEPPPALALEALPDANWVAISQAALPPVIAGRFTVHGSHDRHRVPRGPNALLIDAGEAFGTAHHPTTLGCLVAIDRSTRARRYHRVLDMGCGTGVLAIAARRCLPRAAITASDIDAIAVAVTRQNIKANGATGIGLVCSGRVPRQSGRGARRRRDLIIANILARPLIGLAPQFSAGVARNGTLVLSGLLTSQSREVLGAYTARGFHLVRHEKIGGWSTLTLARR